MPKTAKTTKKSKYLTPREIQLAELDMLLAFDKFAKKYNIRYFLYAGTALGAVRHKGFIPWDDDIDIAISRTEYNKLIKLVSEGKWTDEKLEFVFPELQDEPKFLMGKLYDRNIQTDADDSVDSCNLWLDFFQLDGLSENYRKDFARNAKYIRNFLRLRTSRLGVENNRNYKKLPLYRRILSTTRRQYWKIKNYSKYVEIIRSSHQKYDCETSPYVCNNTWSLSQGDIIPREDIEKPNKVTFEGHNFYIFGHHDKYLSNRYGNYMQLPPEDQRVTHALKAWRIDDEK